VSGSEKDKAEIIEEYFHLDNFPKLFGGRLDYSFEPEKYMEQIKQLETQMKKKKKKIKKKKKKKKSRDIKEKEEEFVSADEGDD